MATMKFGYKVIPALPSNAFPNRKTIARPVIPIKLEHDGKTVGYEALLDSGADWNIFHSVIGEIIGIDVPTGKLQTFGGIGGGQFKSYFHEVTLYIGGWPITVACGFSADIPEPDHQSYGVLGHVGFFDHYVTIFNTSKLEIEIIKKVK